MLKKRAAHLVQVAGDNGVQAWLCAAPLRVAMMEIPSHV
jgi:hypothetical protein